MQPAEVLPYGGDSNETQSCAAKVQTRLLLLYKGTPGHLPDLEIARAGRSQLRSCQSSQPAPQSWGCARSRVELAAPGLLPHLLAGVCV